ncbi:MAG: hypothetical protein ACT4OZ_10045 [Gemmatimonadota bacterium]
MSRTRCGMACTLLALISCGGEQSRDIARSEGFPAATLPLRTQADVWKAATGVAFDISPELVLLVHPTHLPDGAGFDGGEPVPDSLIDVLVRSGVAAGSCTPAPGAAVSRAPSCAADRSGYVVRGSRIFQRSGDTLQFNLRSEVYSASGGPGVDAFAFEMAYRLVPSDGGRFRVVQEGRVRQAGGR